MVPYIVVGISLCLPLVLGIFFRVTTSHLFFSIMAGELLARYFGDEADMIIDSLVRNRAAGEYAEIFILVLPVVLTAVFLHNTLSKNKLVWHVVPLLVTGIVLTAFAMPILPESVQASVRSMSWGGQLLNMSDFIIGVVVLMQLILLWLLNRFKSHDKHHK